jgi:hypothetical protein
VLEVCGGWGGHMVWPHDAWHIRTYHACRTIKNNVINIDLIG